MFCCSKNLRIKAETCADPVWCAICGANLELDELPLSKGLINELWNWNLQYHRWLEEHNYDYSTLDLEFVIQHNDWGLKLTERVQVEIGSEFQVSFCPIKL